MLICVLKAVSQPFASVTKQLYVVGNANSPVAVGVVCVFVQAYVYGGLPPVTATVISPSFPPVQLTFWVAAAEIISGAGSPIVTPVPRPKFNWQPLLSVIWQLYIPAASPEAVAVVCANISFHW